MGKIVSGAGLMAVGYAVSRFLGLVREMAIAWRFGATGATDVYNASFLLPDMLNYLLAGGAFSVVLVPMLARHVRKDGGGLTNEGSRVLSAIFTPLSILVVGLTVGGMVFARPISVLLYPDFARDPERLAILVRLTRIILPAQVFFVVGGLVNATLRARGDFRGNTWGPNIYNLGIILGCIGLGAVMGIDGLAAGVLAGALLGPFLLCARLARGTLRVRLSLDFRSPELVEFVRLNLPLMIGFSMLTVDEWLLRYFGARGGIGAGTITCLKYSRTVMLMPVALVGQTAGQASLTYLSQLWQRGEVSDFSDTLGRTLRGVVFVALVLAGGLFVVATPLTALLFQRGAFTAANSQATADLLQRMVWAAPPFAALQVLVNGYYARKSTLRPMVISSLLAGLSFVVYDLFSSLWGGRGIALSATVCFWLVLVVMATDYLVRHGRGESFSVSGLVTSTAKGLVVTTLAVAAGTLAMRLLPVAASGPGPALVQLTVVGAVYVGIALGVSLIQGGEEGAAVKRFARAVLDRARLSAERGPGGC